MTARSMRYRLKSSRLAFNAAVALAWWSANFAGDSEGCDSGLRRLYSVVETGDEIVCQDRSIWWPRRGAGSKAAYFALT